MARLTDKKILADASSPTEVQQMQDILLGAGFAGLDGATTNPSYFSKSQEVQERIIQDSKFSSQELLASYKQTAQEIDRIIGGDVSIEVYADMDTSADEMIAQARELNSWIPSARIKLPIIKQGLIAAETLKDELRLNMTLCFSQQQAAAVYAATRGAKESVALSPFVGRQDDAGINGVQFVGNVIKMLKVGDGHVQVLTASFRRVDNILEVIRLGSDMLTINFDRFKLWQETGFKLPDKDFRYEFDGQDVPYEEISLNKDWREYDIQHDFTDTGLQKFVDDWNALLK